jgi:cyclophilin family peptidyl-prolyl cis-trans isomerase
VSKRKTRDRQLAKLAARRAAERRKRRRQRFTAGAVAFALAAGGGVFAFIAFTGGKATPSPQASPSARATPTPTPSASYSPGTGKQTGTVKPTAAPPTVACGAKAPAAAAKPKPQFDGPPPFAIHRSKTYVLDMVTSCGTIKIELLADQAPYTVNSLVFLAEHRFFDGQFFHRIVPGFVIQAGDPMGTGAGGPGYNTVDPPPKNAQYPVGTLAMAKTQTDAPGTAGSQFFIVTDSSAQSALAPGGAGQYAIVGHVTSGMDVVDKIAAVPVGGASNDTPQQAVYIEKVTIAVKGGTATPSPAASPTATKKPKPSPSSS